MIRLVTMNVRHALADDGSAALDRLGDVLAGLGADIIALQEVDRGQERSAGADQARVLATAVGAVEYRFVPAVAGPLDPAWRRRRAPVTPPSGDGGGPGYGIALLSRHPVDAWWPGRLPGLNLPGVPPLGVDEPRVALAAAVATPDGPLTVATTHLSQRLPWKRLQLARLRRRLRYAPRPLVVAGDLNVRDGLPARWTGWRELVYVPTYPRARPHIRIDHVLVDGEVTGTARALDLGISDHRAVVADVGLPGSVVDTGDADDGDAAGGAR
jgi:endonuclease/exonuclease/phosphatase family metal-dependent hydrolase